MNPEELEQYLQAACTHQASDLILQENRRAALRISNSLVLVDAPPVTPELMCWMWKNGNLDPADTDGDSALQAADGTRFRVNLHRQIGFRCAVLRRIQNTIPDLEQLGLPADLLREWVDRKSGLIIVCGPTGSGKSTSVASLVNWVNQNRARHIVTIEDPVEYLFSPAQSVITQREVGIDTPSFAEGMRRALRQSPDVLFVGEIRDRATAEIALQASETGHLVLSTLHVGRASEAPNRISLLFPASERDFLSHVLSREITGVLCQRLVTTVDGGMTAALEFFSNTGMVSKLLEENRTDDLADLIAKPKTQDTRSLTQDLVQKCQAGIITEETAKHCAPEPMEVMRALRGIR